ncbi:hypothetical protein [Marivirga sp.]|uniref:hypothetical protein n=1 Tax=Marivirga sp. TaxID=2018662 RepID=UPI002D7FF55E|nr:hypothetical protein [Marivirga sp.]HET8860051.1 hypothetical protein [Marivirga sp.]
MKNTNSLNYSNKLAPRGISWKAIFAGTVATLSGMLILNLIGLGIGLFSVEPTEENNPMNGLGLGAIIWWVVSNLIVLFIGGFVAARVGISFKNVGGVIHGIMTWAVYALLSAWLVTSAVGSIISGVGNAVGGVLSTTGETLKEQLGPVVKEQFKGLEISMDDAKDKFYALLEDTGKKELDPENLEDKVEKTASNAKEEVQENSNRAGGSNIDIEEIFSQSKNRFEQSFEALDKQALTNVLVERTDMTESEAKQTVDNTLAEFETARREFEEFLKEAEEKSRVKAEKVSEAVAQASLYMGIALILGLISSALGGFLGVKDLREDYTRDEYHEDDVETDINHRNMR